MTAQGLLLTDDEVVALSVMGGKPWPIGLVTVGTTSEALRAAALRGVRSLTVRGMLTADGEAGQVPHPGVAAAVEVFISAPVRVGAYIAPVDSPDALAGASITAAPIAGIWWIDSTTAQGVHGFRQAGPEQVVDAIADFAEQTRNGTLLAGAEEPSAFACVVNYGSGHEPTVIVGGQAGDAPPWDRAPLAAAVASAAQT